MRKFKLQVQISVDGFVAGENGEMDWMTWNWDDELKKHVERLTEPVDLILLGRKMAAGFVDAWSERLRTPETADCFSRKMVETPKIVFTRSNNLIDRENTETRTGDLAQEIATLKQADGGDIIVYGGAGFVGSLIEHNLIDEYHLFVNPAIIGKGMTIFDRTDERVNLKLIGAKSFACGVAELVYSPLGE